ncbi:hypothetical protein SprV_0702377400 [Sparganum proliferum]
MPAPTDLDLQFLSSWLEHVYIPLFRAYRAKLREQQSQALNVLGNLPTVAEQGDAPSNGSSQHFPHIYPFPDLGFQTPLPTTSSAIISYNSAGYEAPDFDEMPSRPSTGEDSFEHSLPVPTPRHTDSVVRMAAGQTFDVLPSNQIAPQNYDCRTFTIQPRLDEPSTDMDIALLPSLDSEDLVSSDSTEVYLESPDFTPTMSIAFLASEVDSTEDFATFSDVTPIPSIRKTRTRYAVEEAIEVYEAVEIGMCTGYAISQAHPRIHGQRDRAVWRTVASGPKAQGTRVEIAPVCRNSISAKQLPNSRRRRPIMSRFLQRIWRRFCCCTTPAAE